MATLPWVRAIGAGLLLLCGGQAEAIDSVAVSVGRSGDLTAAQAALVYGWPRADRARLDWFDWTGADPRLELGAAVWHADHGSVERRTLFGITATPLLRWSMARRTFGQPFIDFGVGPRLWSGKRIGSDQRFGTTFEFGTTLGVGLRRSGYDAFVRIEHTSNAGLRQPNPGLNILFFGVTFESSH